MSTDFPGANYNAPVGNDDLKFEQQVYKAEFLERMRLVFGHPDYIAASSWGIVTDTDPTAVTLGQLEPLMVEAVDLTVNVSPGIAVTKSGHRIVITSSVIGKQMASTDADAINVVAAKYVLATPTEESPTEYHQTAYRRRLIAPDASLIVVYTLPQWNALLADALNDHVPLAIVQVTVSGTGSKSLAVTHNSASYTWLRPWFSTVDTQHRAMVGSGTVSSTNPHALTFNDLSIGKFTMPMVVRRSGVVISKENSVAGCPGTVCTTTIQPSQILVDDGTVTGIPGSHYVVLPFYPVSLGRVLDTTASPSATELPFELLPGTQIIYQVANVVTPTTSSILQVTATRSTAVEPPSSLVTQPNFTAGNLTETDAIVSGGKVYVNTSAITLVDTMSDASHIPINYRFFFANAAIVKNPQVLLCRTLLSAFGTGIAPSITQLGPGVALVALDSATAGASLSVKVRITGTLLTGAADYEVLTFNSSWVGSTPPSNATQYNQFQRGTKVWSKITTISIDEALNAGDLAAIQVWNAMDPTTAPALSYACPIADAHWDGTKLVAINDIRPITSELAYGPDVDPGLLVLAGAALIQEPPPPTYMRSQLIYIEDFRHMRLSSLITPTPLSWYGFGIGIDAVYGRERTLDGMAGLYESRAMSIRSSIVSCRLTLYPAAVLNHSYSGLLTPAQVWWSGQNETSGIWTNWAAVSGNGIYDIPTTSNSAIRFRILGFQRGVRGYVMTTWG